MGCHGEPGRGSGAVAFSWKRLVLLEMGKETPYNLLNCPYMQGPTTKEGRRMGLTLGGLINVG